MKRLSKYLQGDFAIWVVLFFLTLYSTLAVYSASGMLAYKMQAGNTSFYLIKHVVLLLASFVVIYVIHRIPYVYFSKLSKYIYYLAVILLVLTLLIGTNLNSASRWLTLPGGLSFQTSDFAKIALIMYLARLLAKRKQEIVGFKSAFKIIMIPVLLVCGLIFPADFSTALLLFGVVIAMMFVAQIKAKYILGMIGVALLAGTFFVLVMMAMPNSGRVDTWKARIESFVSGDDESNFQADHARVAIASGGIVPQGPGKSVQRNILPHPYSDFIFAIIVEEWGLIVGGLLVPLFYVILFSRSVNIIRKTKGRFSAYLVSGLVMSLTFQAFANMLVAVNLLPVTGQTLPFVSMGGTSLIFIGIAFGLILSVSRETQKQEIMQEMSSDKVKTNDDE
ncbi:MAG: FtsW/RodA/SpoVE family cell cycle protein [Bacteroidales bacterium]|jgi:cell division protein FtsW|nr:FtsW/RodA/SpoVE family cell cycle protein [Bacteroidales bacterium]